MNGLNPPITNVIDEKIKSNDTKEIRIVSPQDCWMPSRVFAAFSGR